MAGPWDKYKRDDADKPAEAAPAKTGPWTKYAGSKPALPSEPVTAGGLGAAAATGVGQGMLSIPGMAGDVTALAEGVANKAFGEPAAPTPPANPQEPQNFMERFAKKTNQLALDYLPEGWAKPIDFERDRALAAKAADTGRGDVPGTYRPLTTEQLQQGIEKNITGEWHKPQNAWERGVQTTGQVLPMMATGGGSLALNLAKSAGAGAGSELAGQAAHAVFPKSSWAEPVARTVGLLAGTMAPAGARRMITPNPVSDTRLAEIAAAPQKTREAATAGQLTESPFWQSVESRTLSPEKQAAKQQTAFTEDVNKAYTDTGQQIGQIYQTNAINAPNFANLNTQVTALKRGLGRTTGTQAAEDAMGELQREIRLGAMNSPQVMNMPGPRYQYLRDKLQGAIDGESNNTVKKALSSMKESLDNAFYNSLPDQGAALKAAKQEKRNFEIVAGRNPTLSGETNPKDILAAAKKEEGNRKVNLNQSPVAEMAKSADKVMTPLEPPNQPHGPLARLMGAGLGYLAGHFGLGPVEGPVGAIIGREVMGDTGELAKNLISRGVNTGPVQGWLANQAWRPAANAPSATSDMVRALVSPAGQEQVKRLYVSPEKKPKK